MTGKGARKKTTNNQDDLAAEEIMPNSATAPPQQQKRKSKSPPVTPPSSKAHRPESEMHSQAQAMSTESLCSTDSNQPGAISQDGAEPPEQTQQNLPSRRTETSARADLSSKSVLAQLPDSTRIVHAQSTLTTSPLSKMNPIILANCIDDVCGAVEHIQHLKSGGLFITCKTFDQVKLLISTHHFPFINNKIPVKITIALLNQTVSGKIYAPEIQEEPIDTLLTLLQPTGVVAVRRLFSDPNRSHIPLFVITFIGNTCPSSLKIGYSSYKVDTYIPSPIRCYKCCRWGHASYACHSTTVCSQCGSKSHIKATCNASLPKCVNCKGGHESFSKECPVFQQEQDICRLKVLQNISFPEARRQVLSLTSNAQAAQQTINKHLSQQQNTPTMTSINNKSNFPMLPSPKQLSKNTVPTSQSSSQLPINHINDSQESVWITPVQQYKQKTTTNISLQLPQNLSQYQETEEDLDCSLPPIYQTTSTQIPTPQYQAKNTPVQNKDTDTSLLPTLKQCLLMCLPILIKLFLSNTLSTKIECFHELGSLLQLESTVSSVLAELGHTSLSNSQI